MSEFCMPIFGYSWGFSSSENKDRRTADALLGERLCKRDTEALADLYDRYGKVAYSVVLRIVRDASIAEDLVQETFLQIWNKAASFDAERGSLSTWIVRVARNRAIDYLRSSDGRMAARAVLLQGNEAPVAGSFAETAALSIGRQKHLETAFKKLTPHQRTVIQLAYYEGMSQTEMASRLNQPLGTIKTWVRAALRTLREELAQTL